MPLVSAKLSSPAQRPLMMVPPRAPALRAVSITASVKPWFTVTRIMLLLCWLSMFSLPSSSTLVFRSIKAAIRLLTAVRDTAKAIPFPGAAPRSSSSSFSSRTRTAGRVAKLRMMSFSELPRPRMSIISDVAVPAPSQRRWVNT